MADLIHHHFRGNFFTRYVAEVFSTYVPRRVKRLIYLGSTIGVILKNRDPDIKLLKRLNDRMRLAYGATALLLPAHLYVKIWGPFLPQLFVVESQSVPLNELNYLSLKDADCWKLGLFLATRSPVALHYGSIDLMIADVHDLLVFLQSLEDRPSFLINV